LTFKMEAAILAILPPSNKVPGETTIKPKEHALNKDLTKLSRRELLDLKSRQLKLLENKYAFTLYLPCFAYLTMFLSRSWLKKLPDKGEKIQNLYERAVEALEFRTDIDNASKLLSTLNIGSSNLNNLEWEGSTRTKKPQQPLDSDDDEEINPLEILASSNSVRQNQKIVKISSDPNERPLITDQDIKEAREITNGGVHLDPVDEIICNRENLGSDCRFLPYKSTEVKKKARDEAKGNVTPKIRDNSAATPPATKREMVALTLRESIDAEYQNQTLTTGLWKKQAADRLEAKMKELKAAGLEMSAVPVKIVPRADMTKYRLVAPVVDDSLFNDNDDEDKSDDSISDEEAEED
jgi:hypothetical protein